jgi:hypothetical protein
MPFIRVTFEAKKRSPADLSPYILPRPRFSLWLCPPPSYGYGGVMCSLSYPPHPDQHVFPLQCPYGCSLQCVPPPSALFPPFCAHPMSSCGESRAESCAEVLPSWWFLSIGPDFVCHGWGGDESIFWLDQKKSPPSSRCEFH